jgi:hypothetical protein
MIDHMGIAVSDIAKSREQMVVFVCQDNHQPRRQQPILRFAPADAAIEARPRTP